MASFGPLSDDKIILQFDLQSLNEWAGEIFDDLEEDGDRYTGQLGVLTQRIRDIQSKLAAIEVMARPPPRSLKPSWDCVKPGPGFGVPGPGFGVPGPGFGVPGPGFGVPGRGQSKSGFQLDITNFPKL
jgi:hypothetical protein